MMLFLHDVCRAVIAVSLGVTKWGHLQVINASVRLLSFLCICTYIDLLPMVNVNAIVPTSYHNGDAPSDAFVGEKGPECPPTGLADGSTASNVHAEDRMSEVDTLSGPIQLPSKALLRCSWNGMEDS